MTQLLINVGNVANDGQGTPLRTAFQYINSNFTELYNNVQTSPPTSSSGQEGDVPGMIAFDQEYLYVCVYEYDATTIIWYRVAFDLTPW
ncbi:hypothetical protein [Haliscomenobacter sp.]|jgi:hypothetical protein|uniref:hypothetical protein n=1 Tax=Haliscomenobacter sp. TaxID=2717303 RepID=UPI003364CDE8